MQPKYAAPQMMKMFAARKGENVPPFHSPMQFEVRLLSFNTERNVRTLG